MMSIRVGDMLLERVAKGLYIYIGQIIGINFYLHSLHFPSHFTILLLYYRPLVRKRIAYNSDACHFQPEVDITAPGKSVQNCGTRH